MASWIAMVGLLIHKQAALRPHEAAELPPPDAAPEESREEWFSVLQGGRRIGYTHRSVDSTASGTAIQEQSRLTLTMLGSVQTIETSLAADLGARDALERFRFSLTSPAATFRADGRVEGGKLVLSYGASGDEKRQEIPLTEPIELPMTLRPRLAASNPEPGARFTANVFSPLTLRSEPLAVTVEARETIATPTGPVEAIRVVEDHQGLTARAWLDARGATLREQGTLGFTLERASRETALAVLDGAPAPDLAAAARIPIDGAIEDPRSLAHLRVRLSGGAADRVPSDPPRQRVEGGVLEITREAVGGATSEEIADAVARDPAVGAASEPSPFIESDDPAIVATARRIVAGERDPVRAAQRILDWVSANMTQEPSLTVPSAKEVLAARRGDCNEHAVLVAALARAAGIPARVVAGAMYAEDGFYYHAWTELWLGGWVTADAVFRQMPVDATHVKLIEGGPERHLGLAEMVGQLHFAQMEAGS